jgi:putative transposase
MGGIVRNIHGKLIDSNAQPDHVHRLLSLPPALAMAEALRMIKSNSSLWVHQTAHRAAFAWQAGYGGFSVSQSNVPGVVKYIRDQAQHHRKLSFQEEFIAFLKAHRIPYGERYIWEQPLPPLPGLRSGAEALAPTAHAVGYSLDSLAAPPGLKTQSAGADFHQKGTHVRFPRQTCNHQKCKKLQPLSHRERTDC